MTKTLSMGCDSFPKELQGRFWSAVAGLFSCRIKDDSEEYISGQAMVDQAGPGTLASGDGTDSTDSLVFPGVANILVDAVVYSSNQSPAIYTSAYASISRIRAEYEVIINIGHGAHLENFSDGKSFFLLLRSHCHHNVAPWRQGFHRYLGLPQFSPNRRHVCSCSQARTTTCR